MLIRSLITIDNVEISSYVESSTKVVLFNTTQVSRITDSIRYVRDGHSWFSLKTGDRADDITSHLLDYSVSKWYENQHNEDIKHYVSTVLAQPTDLDELHQTNSFSGRNWK